MAVFVCLHIKLHHCQQISQFSQLYFVQYMGLCVFSLPMSLMMIVKIHVLHLIIIIKLEV